jgi:hypothetical protein
MRWSRTPLSGAFMLASTQRNALYKKVQINDNPYETKLMVVKPPTEYKAMILLHKAYQAKLACGVLGGERLTKSWG